MPIVVAKKNAWNSSLCSTSRRRSSSTKHGWLVGRSGCHSPPTDRRTETATPDNWISQEQNNIPCNCSPPPFVGCQHGTAAEWSQPQSSSKNNEYDWNNNIHAFCATSLTFLPCCKDWSERPGLAIRPPSEKTTEAHSHAGPLNKLNSQVHQH